MASFSDIRRKLKARLQRRGESPDAADDLIQEAFLRFETYEAKGDVREPEGFIARTVVNLAIDASRRRHRSPIRVLPDEDLAGFADASPGPAEEAHAANRLKRLSEGLETLPARTRRILLAQRVDGLSYAAIAREEGITVSAVEKHVAKGILLLTRWMHDED
jgi:RNA polymerase sigma factor (sigma-70 family)